MNLFMQMLLATPKITQLFSNTSNVVTEAGGGFIAMLGVVLIIVGAVFLGSNLLAKGQPKTPWVIVALMVVVGGVFAFGGVSIFMSAGQASNETVKDIVSGVILPLL